jgi:hypothetical protein
LEKEGRVGWEKIKVGWQLSRDIIDLRARWLEYEILEAGYDGMYLDVTRCFGPYIFLADAKYMTYSVCYV